MKKLDSCLFCQPEEIKFKYTDGSECNRCIYENDYCYAVLTPEQYTIGHSLVILNWHVDRIFDNLDLEHFSGFFNSINHVARLLINSVVNDTMESPQNVYVGVLCDGFEHLHAHLVPRYPFKEEDRDTYRKLFKDRDGNKLEHNISSGNIGGFWILAEKEREWKITKYGRKTDEEKKKFLEYLRGKIKDTDKQS
jgi:diadenosine tetraphosphate (Ap4A) HIT family hydrolase